MRSRLVRFVSGATALANSALSTSARLVFLWDNGWPAGESPRWRSKSPWPTEERSLHAGDGSVRRAVAAPDRCVLRPQDSAASSREIDALSKSHASPRGIFTSRVSARALIAPQREGCDGGRDAPAASRSARRTSSFRRSAFLDNRRFVSGISAPCHGSWRSVTGFPRANSIRTCQRAKSKRSARNLPAGALLPALPALPRRPGASRSPFRILPIDSRPRSTEGAPIVDRSALLSCLARPFPQGVPFLPPG